VYRQIQKNPIVRVRFIDGMDVGLSVIRSFPHTRDVIVEENACAIEMEATSDEEIAGLLDQLIANGVRVLSFGRKEPTLEDVFMLVTKGLVA